MANFQWKYNKHGNEEQNTIQCYKCQWYQPDLEEQEPSLRRTARVDPVEPEGAAEIGYCRKKSVPIMNLNSVLDYQDKNSQLFTADPFMSQTETLNECIQNKANEFWCRQWVRSITPFLWPPIPGN